MHTKFAVFHYTHFKLITAKNYYLQAGYLHEHPQYVRYAEQSLTLFSINFN